MLKVKVHFLPSLSLPSTLPLNFIGRYPWGFLQCLQKKWAVADVWHMFTCLSPGLSGPASENHSQGHVDLSQMSRPGIVWQTVLYTMHCKDFSKLKKTIVSLGLFISRQPDTEQIYLICNKACVNLIWLTSVGMRASAKPLSFPPGLEVFICYPCVFPLSGLKHTNFWERFSTTHRNFPVHPKLVVS